MCTTSDLWSLLALTMVIPYYTELLNTSATNYNFYKMLPLVFEQNKKKHDHITPNNACRNFTGFPFDNEFNSILLNAFKSQFGLTPSYIANLLVPYTPSRTLRSFAKSLLTIPRTSSSYGDRAFSACAPKLWNALPNNIRRCSSLPLFKNLLKTHLFKSSYT